MGEGQAAALPEREPPLLQPVVESCGVREETKGWSLHWLRQCKQPCPPRGCWRPSPSGRGAVTLLVLLEGRGLWECFAPLSGPNAGSLGSMGERSAYQRLSGVKEGQQVTGKPGG